jgi:ABC-2 type transport system ATP-binding protein
MLAIEARNITVEYRTPKYQTSTLKEYVINALHGRNHFSVHRALEGVSVTVAKGESVALIGHNGSGKSTLLKVLAGIIQPPGAEVLVRGRIAPMIELGAGFDFELSGIENIYLSCTLMGLSRAEIASRIEDIVRFAELKDFIHMPFKNFSSGMQARLGFACATAVDPDVILADEVLAVGDSNFAKKCLFRIEELREKGAALILVSHDPSAVKRFCSRAYVFNRGKCMFNGTVDEALAFNDRVMDNRFQDELKEREKKSSSRESISIETKSEQAKSTTPMIPEATATAKWSQNNSFVYSVNVEGLFLLTFR